jgi:hypothetical protein
MLILDFSKAFDTVPHKRLLKKLEPYGINGNILSCLEAWLRFQTLNSDSAVSVKYLISRNYYIQIIKTWYYIYAYTTNKGYSG